MPGDSPYDGWDPTITIGTRPFSYDRSNPDVPVLRPAVGGVRVGANVDVFPHVNIDNGIERDTVIGDHSKIDRGVQVGHDAIIGRANIVCAGAEVGGYCETGDRVYIGMGALIKPRVRIGDDAIIGMGAVVKQDVPAREVWDGNPAKRVMSRDVFDGLKGHK